MLELDPSNQDDPKAVDVNGDRLRELRLLARLDLSELAKRAALSSAQLEQLENGTHGSFYNASIRRQAARKVALILGADPESVIEASAPEATVTPALVIAESSAVPAPTPERHHLQGWFLVRLQSVFSSLGQTEIKARLPRQLKLAGVAGLTLLMLGVWATVKGFSSDRTKLEPSSLESAAMPVKTTAAAQGAPIGPTVQTPSTIHVVDSVPAKTDNGCDMVGAGFAELQAPKALKGAGMVYVVGATGQVVCVRDAGGQAWRHVFGEQRGQSFHGRPPWQLHSPQLAQMQLYFQGSLIRLPTHGLLGVTLQEKESS
jgi:transcriptional regulator with XRE-family HTH domain